MVFHEGHATTNHERTRDGFVRPPGRFLQGG